MNINKNIFYNIYKNNKIVQYLPLLFILFFTFVFISIKDYLKAINYSSSYDKKDFNNWDICLEFCNIIKKCIINKYTLDNNYKFELNLACYTGCNKQKHLIQKCQYEILDKSKTEIQCQNVANCIEEIIKIKPFK